MYSASKDGNGSFRRDVWPIFQVAVLAFLFRLEVQT